MIYGIRTGRFLSLMSTEEAAAHLWLPAAKQMRSNRILGTAASVVTQLDELVRETQADEVMVTTSAHNIAERMRTLSLLAQAWQPHAASNQP
jgi:alkanesulfonate monooxygenase SsuD/methylene tetrahydromethanopterin reductase-like flavin-dependent oxidoreductase (luciferase family)